MSHFDKAYIEYSNCKKAKSGPNESGKQVFKWEGVQLHHISVVLNQVDYLVHDGIVICTFPLKTDRNKVIYPFIERKWKDVIKPFCEYIKKRREDE